MATETAKWEKSCEVCGAVVKYAQFGPCKEQPGNHSVESKTYYHNGARDIQDVRDRKKFGPLILLRAAQTVVDPHNPDRRDIVQGISVKFEHGKYTTSDGEEQYLLDRRGFPSGEEGLSMWKAVYWTPERQAQQAVADAKSAQLEHAGLMAQNRKLREENDLLTQTKAKAKKAE